MQYSIERVAVIGAGVMGATLAAHLANAGIRSLLLDIVPPEGMSIDRYRGLKHIFEVYRCRSCKTSGGYRKEKNNG